jgi:ketosteroid isomerase-like protein
MKSFYSPARTIVTVVLAGVAMSVQGCSLSEIPDVGRTDIGPRAVIKAEDETVGDILAAFNRAEEALHARDIDALMKVYSRDYHYRDLMKDDVRKIWENLFAKYSQISSTHVFSQVVAEGRKPSTAKITCTGRLWGTSKESGERVIIDSWFFEVHHLVSEDGAWLVRGVPGEPSEALGFPVIPHPFF